MRKMLCLAVVLLLLALALTNCMVAPEGYFDGNNTPPRTTARVTGGGVVGVRESGVRNDEQGGEDAAQAANGQGEGEYPVLDLPLVKYNNTYQYDDVRGYAIISQSGTLTVHSEYGRPLIEQPISSVRSLAYPYNHANNVNNVLFYITEDDALWAIGSNKEGLLGDNTGVDRTEPVKIMDDVANIYFADESFIAANAYALKNDGSLWAWGSAGVYGGAGYRLGFATEEPAYAPVKIFDEVVGFYCSSSSSDIFCALLRDGSLYAFGSSEPKYGAPSEPTKIMGGVVSVGANKRAYGAFPIVTSENKLYLWGRKDSLDSLLGEGERVDFGPPEPYWPEKSIKHAVLYGAGSQCSLFMIDMEDTLWAVGFNENGALGDGTKINRKEPVEIMKNVKAITDGLGIIGKDGALYAIMSYDEPKREKVASDVVAAWGSLQYIDSSGTLWDYYYDWKEKVTNVKAPNYPTPGWN
ncbi:MAG: hypothetical protein LBD02_08750 [Christensenellaceae bacterium]|jgi:hypothetical protein|nr:hypothetical protein [Christensenellaceae bacterium]